MLTVRKADRQRDKGLYKLRLTCEGGNFEATGFVNVLDTSNESATGIRVATRIPVRVAGSNPNLATTPGVQGNKKSCIILEC